MTAVKETDVKETEVFSESMPIVCLPQVREAKIQVIYGMGACCTATLPEDKIQNMTWRELILASIRVPEQNNPAQRTSKVIEEAISHGSTLDIEVALGAQGKDLTGMPVEIGDKVGNILGSQKLSTAELTIMVSESYVGGVR